MATFSKPTKIPEWADTGTIVEPSESKKDTGWIFEEVPPFSFFNWHQNLVGQWIKWIDERFFDGTADKDLEVTGVDQTGTDQDGGDLALSGGDSTGSGSSDVLLQAAIAGAAGVAARVAETFLKLDGATGLLNAVKAWVGSGTGAGLEATGGSTSGPGLKGTGGTPNGEGVVGTGAGTGPGVEGTSGSSVTGSIGVKGIGDASGAAVFCHGVRGEGDGIGGTGVEGVGSSTNGKGGEFTSTGNAPAVRTSAPFGAASLEFGQFLEGVEMVVDPAAPPAPRGRIYFRDTGGKTELVVRFPTGAIQQIAIEP